MCAPQGTDVAVVAEGVAATEAGDPKSLEVRAVKIGLTDQ